VAPGETIEVEVHDTSGGQITPRTSAGDLPNLDYSRFTPLTGPIAVDGAMPGDTIKITFLSFAMSGWGWSVVSPRYGILAEDFSEPLVKIWTYDPSGAQPAMYNDVARVPLKPFPGIIGLAPGEPGTHSALPPRHVGGNLDVRDLSCGTELFLPVEVSGGLLSLGDTHAAQGNGELAGTALESPMTVAIKVDLIRGWRTPGPRLTTQGPVARHLDHAGYHVTCGVDTDLVEAARTATRHMIDLLGHLHHLAPIDAYLLCSVCGDLSISEMVNRPVNVVSLYFPRVVLE
jgi:acetamidase/formamidase